jgi:transcriptional regulator of acetoin/glycerol metabolism
MTFALSRLRSEAQRGKAAGARRWADAFVAIAADLLLHALDLAKGHVPTTARILGLSRSQTYRLYKRMRLQQA